MRYLFPFLAVTIALCACRVCEKAHYYRQHAVTKKYFPALTDKSYFVYRNEIDTMDIDTLYVVHTYDSLLFRFVETKCDGDYYQQQGYSLQWGKQRGSVEVAISSTRSDQYRLTGTYKNFEIFSNLSVDQSGEMSVSNVARDTLVKLPSHTMGGKTYSEVIRISSNTLFTRDGLPRKYYYAPNIGVIQFDAYDKANFGIGGTYQLVAYSIK